GGGRVYFQGISGEIAQFSLTTPWDIESTVSHEGSFQVNAGETLLRSFFLSSDGGKLFTLSEDSRTIYAYTLGTAWDITTASFDGVSLDTGFPFLRELRFSPDGTRLYVHNILDVITYQFDLELPWDISSARPAGSVDLGSHITS